MKPRLSVVARTPRRYAVRSTRPRRTYPYDFDQGLPHVWVADGGLHGAHVRKPATDTLDRTVLPIPEPRSPPITEIDARKAKAPPRFEVKAPEGAPNVVIVLIDDIGFGHSSAFGGPCQMPTCEKLANNGLRFNRFHTTALCSPTRTALLTGRNHHVNNAGAIMELATAFPGNTGVRPESVAPLAEILRHERLQHRGLRQVPRDAAVGSLGLGAVRSLADALGVRQVLRLHRRRNEPVGAGDLRRRRPRRGAARSQLPLHHRHDQPGHRLGALPAGPDARQAVLHVLRHRRDARAAPRAEGVHRQVQGQVRPGLGQAPRGDARSGRSSWASCRRAPS